MKFDLHTHHYRCGHAIGTISDYIEAAIDANFQVIGISDHSPFFASQEDQKHPLIAMGKQEFTNYIHEVLQLKEAYKHKIDVLLGVESDFFPKQIHIYQKEFERYPFDYIIGSVHSSNGVSIFNKNRWRHLSLEQKIEEKATYFSSIKDSARSGVFQILGHIDAMKGNYPAFTEIPAPEEIEEMLRVIRDCGVAIEVNTSGKTKLSGGWYPTDDILERACHYGVDITFGSDAHDPKRVGDDWEKVRHKLIELGFKSWVYYKQKQKQVVSLQ